MNVKHLLLAAGFAATGVSRADQNLETAFRRNGDSVVAVFEDQRAILQRSSAVIQEGWKKLVYGTVVSEDGFILTKASEISGRGTVSVTIDAKSYPDARVVATDPVWDVALIKIDATGLLPVVFSTAEPSQGTWVVANGVTTRARRRALVGIISANTREIPASGGAALGVVFKEGKKLVIEEVTEKSGAASAGLKPGDQIVAIGGTPVAKSAEVSDQLKDAKAGSSLKVTYRRDGKEQTVEVTLAARGEIVQEETRNDQMSGDFSPRRSGFPRVIQHDVLAARDSVGGPLLDLDGHCVGMNIARADRAQSFAIPAAELKELTAALIARAK